MSCVVALALMIFMLPAGILDGLLPASALVLILSAWYPTASITRPAAVATRQD